MSIIFEALFYFGIFAIVLAILIGALIKLLAWMLGEREI
tara:strand:- start:461 stop:577 length:117 start_codon:yes stop_codon:yes gene_type:complete